MERLPSNGTVVNYQRNRIRAEPELEERSLVTEDPSLREDALCAQTDPEAFFPEKGGSTKDAKKVCGDCMVRSACLAFALANDERFGVWGGLSERERRRLKNRVDGQSQDNSQVPQP